MSHPQPEPNTGTRLQKVLAAAGVASRRNAETLIAEGRVKVNGRTVRTPGVRVDPDNDVIHVDDLRIVVDEEKVYLALNKPPGVLSAMSDDRGRPTVGDYVRDRTEQLFHVGRLDQASEGLLIMTNDGELANRLMHPSYEVIKVYMAEVPGPIPRDLGRRLKAGVVLDDGPVSVDSYDVVDQHNGRAILELGLHEGRKHVVRRMLEAVDHPVSRLVRTEIGPVKLGHQRPGTVRHLSSGEIGHLYRIVGL